MTEDEMNEELDNWWLDQEDDARAAFDNARHDVSASSIKAEYWFMKGWVARNA